MNNKIKIIVNNINSLAADIDRPINIMELCGTHTQAVAKHGLKTILPKNINLITGPGCPVCITAQEDIDKIVKIALAGIPVATFGDMLRVPGQYGSLEDARSNGAKIFEVYSANDALNLMKDYKNLVFFGLGFETTAPGSAYGIINGLTVYSTHKLFLPAMTALLKIGEIKIDGFLNPGHVSAIVGVKPYKKFKCSQVIAGFTGEDILKSIYLLLKQIKTGNTIVENEYSRVVKYNGNKKAYDYILKVFDIKDGNWRGFGVIPKSGLELKNKYKTQDAKILYKDIISEVDSSKYKKNNACICHKIIRGLCSPAECKMFAKTCTSEKPYGPCMVSVEGACNVKYREL